MKKLLAFVKKMIVIFVFKKSNFKKFKNKHQGESCLIIGDGLSLKWVDLDVFSDQTTFFLNMGVFNNKSINFKNKYLLINEPYWFWPYIRIGEDKKIWWNKINIKHKIFSEKNNFFDIFVDFSNFPFTTNKKYKHLFRYIPDKDFLFQNKIIEYGIDPFARSLFCALTLAVYMGFEKIQLLGCDQTHGDKAKAGHWYEKGHGEFYTSLELLDKYFIESKEMIFYKEIQETLNIETITIEPAQGAVLPSITYESLTGAQPSYKENHELTEIEVLKVLSTYPYYDIF